MHGWKDAHPSDKPASKLKNFQELNRQAINSNVHTAKVSFFLAKDQQKFRQTRDIMVNVKEGQKVVPIMLPE